MNVIVTVLTESKGRIRHHFDNIDCRSDDLVSHLVVLFAGVYKDCGDFVITSIEIRPVISSGAHWITQDRIKNR